MRPLASGLLALVSFIGTAGLLHQFVPLPNQGTISDKLEYFFEHGDE